MDPVTIAVAISGIISLITTAAGWMKKYAESTMPVLVPLGVVSQTHPPKIIPPSNEDVEYEGLKKNKPLSNYQTDDHKSSLNSSPILPLIFIFVVILGIMGFIVYRKRNKLKENSFRFQETERQFDSPPSPTTAQADSNLTIV